MTTIIATTDGEVYEPVDDTMDHSPSYVRFEIPLSAARDDMDAVVEAEQHAAEEPRRDADDDLDSAVVEDIVESNLEHATIDMKIPDEQIRYIAEGGD